MPPAARSTTARSKAPVAKGKSTPARPRASRARPAQPDPSVIVEDSGGVTHDDALPFVPESVRADFNEQLSDDDLSELTKVLESEEGPIGPGGVIRPVTIGKKGKKGPELVHIFTIGERRHFIPKNPTLAVLIQFLRDARTKGRDEATENLLTSVLGDANLNALASSPEVDEEDVAAVFTIVSHIAFGALAKFRKAADPS